MAAVAAKAAGAGSNAGGAARLDGRAAGDGWVEVLADRPDGVVVRSGAVVAKAHCGDTDVAALQARLRIAADPMLHGVVLAPLPVPQSVLCGRPVTIWPYGEPVGQDDPDAAPWTEVAVLLAKLHSVPLAALPGPVPVMRGPVKVARAAARLRLAARERPLPASAEVLRAYARLPGWARGDEPPSSAGRLCHGDLHLGQLVRLPLGGWRLIDVDDLGVGDPAWDLARPAAWFATGLLPPEVFGRFLGAYRSAGGCAVPAEGDPWARLDVPAQALTVQSAALAVVRANRDGRPLDDVDRALVDACARINRNPPAGVTYGEGT